MSDSRRAEAALWATWSALTGEAPPGDAAALVAAHPDIADAARPPLDRPARDVDVDREGRGTALHALIATAWESWHLIALLNWREGPTLAALHLERCGILPGDEWIAYDFWGRGSLGIATHAVGRRLPARSCLLLGLRRNLARPQVSGTTGHIAMGARELADVGWDEANSTLRGRAAPTDAPLAVMMRVPHPYLPIDARGAEVGPIAEARAPILLPPSDEWRDWSVSFRRDAPDPRRQRWIAFDEGGR